MKQSQRHVWGGSYFLTSLFLAMLVLFTCLSMTTGLHNSGPGHGYFWQAVVSGFALLGFIPLFLYARFSFGYFVGISFYVMLIGFVWLTYFTTQAYDHSLARYSATVSLLLFLFPALFQTKPLTQALMLSPRGLHQLILVLLGFSFATLALGAFYGFALVGFAQGEQLRGSFPRPIVLEYTIGWVTIAILPFVFAVCAWRGRYALASVAILLESAFYPIVLNKTVAFGSLWLPFLFLFFRWFEPKRAIVCLWLVAMLPGIIVYNLMAFGWLAEDGTIGRMANFLIGIVNVRMAAFPSIAMSYYSEFFSSHPLTHFCQINIIRIFSGCPYTAQLSIVLSDAYGVGYFNGSLFTTEGIASVGPLWAPVSALFCGLIVSLGNSVSTRLPAAVVGTSAGLAVHASLLNVPLSTSLLSNGLLILWSLWSITPDLSPQVTSSNCKSADDDRCGMRAAG